MSLKTYSFYGKEMLKHWFVAKRLDNIHSPFLFEFCQKVIFNKSTHPKLELIHKLRETVLSDNSEFHSFDYEFYPPKPQRKDKIKNEADRTAIKKKWGRLLFYLIMNTTPKNLLEMGTNTGVSAAYQLAALETYENVKFVSIERNPDLINYASLLNNEGDHPENLEFLAGSFQKLLPVVLSKFQMLDYCFIDGDHQGQRTIEYYNLLVTKAHSKTIFVFDDINWSPEMKNSWNYICKDKKNTLCLDLFKMGIVFFNPDLSKEVIKLRA